MTTKVSLQIVGRDLFDESVDEIIPNVLEHAVMIEVRGRHQILSVFVENDIVVEAAVEVARKLEHHVEGAQVVGVERDAVSTTDIAHRVGVSREAVRKWALSESFPIADGYLESASMEYWSWVKVVDWLLEERSIDMDEILPSMAQIAQIEHNLMCDSAMVDLKGQCVSRQSPTTTTAPYKISG